MPPLFGDIFILAHLGPDDGQTAQRRGSPPVRRLPARHWLGDWLDGENAACVTLDPQTTHPFSTSASRIAGLTSIDSPQAGQTKVNSSLAVITYSYALPG